MAYGQNVPSCDPLRGVYSDNLLTQLTTYFSTFLLLPCHINVIFQINADTPNPEGGTFVRDKDGNLTGQMFEAATMVQFIAKAGSPNEKEIKDAITAHFQYYASVGFTTVTDLGYIPNPDVDRFVKELAGDECPIRVGKL